MDLADLMATLLNEALETAMLDSTRHALWTNFTVDDIGGSGGGNITVSVSNIDDIIRNLKRKIREANGESLMQQRGAFIVWRAEDFEKLEAFMMANGFNTADSALKNGALPGVHYGGVDHYVSNSHAAASSSTQHLFAGVKNTFSLGILSTTYGQTIVYDEPTISASQLSAVGVTMRTDYIFKAWNNTSTVLFDVTVAG